MCSQTRFLWFKGHLIPFSCFAILNSFGPVPRASGRMFMFSLPYSFSTVPRASGLVIMFCAQKLIFSGTEGVGSRFYILCFRNHFRRYQGRRVTFSCFTLPNPFWALPMASGPFFMFFALGLVFSATRALEPVFIFSTPELIFGSIDGVGSRFHILRSRTYFRRYRGRGVSFSCFALLY
jgi:hypothetical protein